MTYTQDLVNQLCERDILVPVAPGLYEQGAAFRQVREGVADALRSMWTGGVDLAINVPSVLPADVAVRAGYVAAFPHLLVVGKGFKARAGAYAVVAKEAVTAGGDVDKWAGVFDQTQYVLTPAACHGVYPVVPVPVPSAGFRVEAEAACFRNEASTEPGRFLWFHMLELVQFGSEGCVQSFMSHFTQIAKRLFDRLGLASRVLHATDPFFLGDRMASLVESSDLRKREFVVNLVPSSSSPVAIGSINDHGQHFTKPFGIADHGEPTVSACVGFGLERIVLCLYGQHGIDPRRWPQQVCDLLQSSRR